VNDVTDEDKSILIYPKILGKCLMPCLHKLLTKHLIEKENKKAQMT